MKTSELRRLHLTEDLSFHPDSPSRYRVLRSDRPLPVIPAPLIEAGYDVTILSWHEIGRHIEEMIMPPVPREKGDPEDMMRRAFLPLRLRDQPKLIIAHDMKQMSYDLYLLYMLSVNLHIREYAYFEGRTGMNLPYDIRGAVRTVTLPDRPFPAEHFNGRGMDMLFTGADVLTRKQVDALVCVMSGMPFDEAMERSRQGLDALIRFTEVGQWYRVASREHLTAAYQDTRYFLDLLDRQGSRQYRMVDTTLRDEICDLTGLEVCVDSSPYDYRTRSTRREDREMVHTLARRTFRFLQESGAVDYRVSFKEDGFSGFRGRMRKGTMTAADPHTLYDVRLSGQTARGDLLAVISAAMLAVASDLPRYREIEQAVVYNPVEGSTWVCDLSRLSRHFTMFLLDHVIGMDMITRRKVMNHIDKLREDQ